MKKTQLVILIAGLTSFFLTLVFGAITTVVLIKDVRKLIGSTTVREGIEFAGDIINKYTGSNVITLDDGTQIQFGEIHVDDHNGTTVDIDSSGIDVETGDGQDVHVGLDGIRIDAPEEDDN